MSESKIIADCERQGASYEDPNFPLASATNVPGATWQRPAHALGVESPTLFAPEGRGTAAFVMGASRL
eukprot:6193731-Prymnesium_polylepis.1